MKGRWGVRSAYGLVWRGPDEGKELAQQDAVGGLVSAVLDGQGLQQGEGAAPVAGGVVAPPVGQTHAPHRTVTQLHGRVCTFSQ